MTSVGIGLTQSEPLRGLIGIVHVDGGGSGWRDRIEALRRERRSDVGIDPGVHRPSHLRIKAWRSILEAGFVVFRWRVGQVQRKLIGRAQRRSPSGNAAGPV